LRLTRTVGWRFRPAPWMVPIATTPPDLREDVCEHNRRHRPTKDGDEGGEAGTAPAGGTNGERHVLPLSSLWGAGVLTSGLAAGIPPVEVYTGRVRDSVASGAATAAAPAPNKKPVAVVAKPPAGKRPSPFRGKRRHREHSG
jgi:hypothetical protein